MVPASLLGWIQAARAKRFGPQGLAFPGREVWQLAEIHVITDEPLEVALRRFKRKVQQEDIIKDVKRHSYYLKPGEKRRLKQALARKRRRKRSRSRARSRARGRR